MALQISSARRFSLINRSLLIVRQDPKHSQHEARFYALGRTDSNRLLFVAFTVRRNLIRVISAREMSRTERRIYEAYDEQEKPENPSDV